MPDYRRDFHASGKYPKRASEIDAAPDLMLEPSMPLEIPESDWKVLRKLKPIALDRFCKRALAEMKYRAMADDGEHHAAYLAVYQAMQDRDDELATAFNHMSRSQAFLRLISIRRLKLLTDEEWSEFSEATREAVFRAAEI